ncbi:MAG: MoaD/ThiS family protein [Planctomycetota bacterium]
MRLTVRYGAQAREAAGREEEVVDLPAPATVGGLLARLAERHGDPLRGLLLRPDGTPHPSVLVVRGDEQARPEDFLSEGQTVWILTPISGG